jgi:cytochrome c biogenesis protein CcmG, thiol:disulfide interchange protein DsbE
MTVQSSSSRRRNLRGALTGAALIVLIALAGCAGSSSGNPDSRISAAQAKQPLTGAPPQLVSIRSQAGQLLSGGKDAFDARLAQLKGIPVVVNKWASWCGPCRFEFPWFQSLAEKSGGRIAFLGVNGNDSDGAARQFLSELPVPYPSYSDPNLDIGQNLGGPPQAFPTTTFYDSSGKLLFSHPGAYQHESDLDADVDRYAK